MAGALVREPLPFDVWFFRKIPVEHLYLKHGMVERVKAPWVQTLKADIEKRGLGGPLLAVKKSPEHRIEVRTGQNRLRILRELGWKNAPVVLCGTYPEEAASEGVPLKSLHDVQQYFIDGVVGKAPIHGFLKITGCMLPEHEKYPKFTEAYFDA